MVTRVAVINTWAKLTEAGAIPLGHWMEVTKKAVLCLHDESKLVQKAAVGLLKSLLSFNPFGEKLDSERFQGSLDEFKAKLQVSAVLWAGCGLLGCGVIFRGELWCK